MVAQLRAPSLLPYRVMRTLSTPSSRHAAPLFVVSPHLDDAVFSCGMLLASRPGSIVCTVFCGEPDPPQHTPWDRCAGHGDSREALRARIAEDERALALVRAQAIRLPFLDSQYGATPALDELVHALTLAWRDAQSPRFVAPLGLYHSDHVLVGDACRAFVREQGLTDAIVYEDALYRTIRGVARRRYEALTQQGYSFAPLECPASISLRPPGAASAKWRAVRAYRSQLLALADAHPYDLVEPERYRVIDRIRPSPYRSRSPSASGAR
ncbi:PIG-L family deacetylase [Trinickia sp. NRRL B-1857]|uniref:PIG-L deacetylase family protein n=1 Tax=Trinickia sp. NRRL B-1857 TaxID=3162879 RepID=UPI003D2E4404